MLYDMEQRQEAAEQRQAATEQQVAKITERVQQTETAVDYFSVIGYHRYVRRNGDLTLPQASAMGKKATGYCQDHGVPMSETPDPRYGRVNTYPKWVLDHLFGPEQSAL